MKERALVKIGGSLAEDTAALKQLAAVLARYHQSGARLVLVHGGGKEINRNLELLSEKPRFEQGLRVTDAPAMKMVEMTLSGYVNKWLVRMLLNEGCRAIGVSGVDAGLMKAEKRRGTPDLGLVGKIVDTDPSLINHLWSGGYLPIVSPISLGEEYSVLNINADEAASALAAALQVDRLLFVSDVPGVLNDGKVIPKLNREAVDQLEQEGVITGGMIPKTRGCLESLDAGIKEVHICGWSGAKEFEEQLTGQANRGTIFKKNP
jgi:acetylglutamate kinase